MLEWPLWNNRNAYRLFTSLLFISNNQETITTSVIILSEISGLSAQEVRTSLLKLKKNNDITIKTTNKNTIITICNYNYYNSEDNPENKAENKKEDIQKINSHFVIPNIEEIDLYIKSKGVNVDAEAFFNFYESKGWMIGKNKMKNWKAAVGTWTRNRRNFNSYRPIRMRIDGGSKDGEF